MCEYTDSPPDHLKYKMKKGKKKSCKCCQDWPTAIWISTTWLSLGWMVYSITH